MVFIGILSWRQGKNRDLKCHTFASSLVFSRPASRHPLTKNTAKVDFTVNYPVLHKLDCEENLSFEMFALSPLRATDCIGVKS